MPSSVAYALSFSASEVTTNGFLFSYFLDEISVELADKASSYSSSSNVLFIFDFSPLTEVHFV